MADSSKKVKVKRMDELKKILAQKEEPNEVLKPVRPVSEEDVPVVKEEYDIGQSDNKSGRGMGWYVVHTYSGYEKKVKMNIEKSIKNRAGLEEKILEVRVPTQDVTEMKTTGKKTSEKKILPGYVLVHMDADDNDAWYVVRNTRGVTGFVGPGSKPVPLEEDEVSRLDKGSVYKSEFEIGDMIMVIDGVWKDTTGVVNKVDENKRTATITVELFDRETKLEISVTDLKKIN